METVNDIIDEIRQIAHNISVADDKTLALFRNVAALARIADRLDAAYKRDMDTLREENEWLNAALKPVLEVGWEERKYSYCSGTVPTKDLVLVVRDAQRIYNGGAK